MADLRIGDYVEFIEKYAKAPAGTIGIVICNDSLRRIGIKMMDGERTAEDKEHSKARASGVHQIGNRGDNYEDEI